MVIKCFAVVSVLCVLDIVTGLLQSLKNANFKSSLMRKGLFSKLAIILGVLLCVIVIYAMDILGYHTTVPLIQAYTGYVVVMECGSIVENLCKVNESMKDIFERIMKLDKEESAK